jgi:hypothetical protein
VGGRRGRLGNCRARGAYNRRTAARSTRTLGHIMRGSILLVVLAFSSVVAQGSGAIPLQIGGISPGDDQSAVVALLGEPARTIQTGDALDPQLEFPGLTIWMWDGRHVAQIRSTNTKYCFLAVVCPGDPAAVLSKKIGKPTDHAKVSEGLNTFHFGSETCWLEAFVSNQMVTALELKCQP